MNKENRSRRVRLISVILTLALVIGLFPLKPVKADNGDITENDLKVTYHTVSAWGEYTQVEVTVENKGGSPTTDWQIQFEYDDVTTISSIWNAVAAPSDMSALNLITVSNETYNAKIAPNEMVSFGLIVLGSAYVIPVASELKSIASDIRREDNEDSLVADILDGLGDALLETVYAIASLLLGGPVGTISSAITAIGIIAILL